MARAIAGDQVAEETTQAILAIQESAQRINEVTEVVEGLSFQTSILAINAAVEAARAGDAGKGFAIVAQEVRSLAMRSNEAAKMIAAQTAESVAQISIGADKVQATREVLAPDSRRHRRAERRDAGHRRCRAQPAVELSDPGRDHRAAATAKPR